jgi:hypothetical protein
MRVLLLVSLASGLCAQPPVPAASIQTVIANEFQASETLGEYTFSFEKVHRTFSKSGKLDRETTERGETYMSHRRNTDITLIWNGKPLQSKDLEKNRKAATKRLEADFRERQSAKYVKKPTDARQGPGFSMNGLHLSVIDVLRYCQLSAPRADGARDVVSFERCKSPWPEEKHYVHLKGTVWIDRKGLRADAWQAFTTAGKLLFAHTTQVAPGGERLPHTWHLDLRAGNGLFTEDRRELLYRWDNPQRFSVEVNQTIAPPQQ